MDLAYLKEIGVASYGQDDQQLPTAVELCSITLTADKSASLKVESGESDQVLTQVMNDTAIAEKKNMNLAGSKIELTALEAPTLLVSLGKRNPALPPKKEDADTLAEHSQRQFLATAAPPPPDQGKMLLKETNAVDAAQMGLELPPRSDHDSRSGSLHSKDTFGATSEEKANGSGDVRTDLQEALATSVAVAPEPYDPPRLIRDAPINQDGKGEKGEQEKGDRKGKGRNATGNVDKDEVVAEALLNLKGGKGEKEKGGGKGKGSNATGNVANDTVVAEAPLNLDVKGGKGENEKGGGKGRAKCKGKKGGKDSAGKGNWDHGHGKGKAKGKGKKDSNGHGKGANGPEHQQVMPETQFNMDVLGGKGEWEKGYRKGWGKGKGKKGSKSKGANDAGHQNFKGGKGYRNKGNVKGNAKGKGKKGGKNFQAKGVWDKGYGKGGPKGNKGYGKGKGKKGLEQNIYM